jgi:hypothetical protein
MTTLQIKAAILTYSGFKGNVGRALLKAVGK